MEDIRMSACRFVAVSQDRAAGIRSRLCYGQGIDGWTVPELDIALDYS
jgi:hypothetical protein